MENFTEYPEYGTLYPPIMAKPSHHLRPLDVIALVIYMAVFLMGVPGNALVVWVTAQEAKRVINAIWFLNLAVADLLSCLALPVLFVSIIQDGHWSLGEAACHILPSLILLNLYASILLLATISADRFLLVFNPIWCQNFRGARLAWLLCGLAWALALVLTIPSFLYRSLLEEHFPPKKSCGVNYGPNGEHKEMAVAMMRLVIGFLLPLLTLSVCYAFLLLRTWRRKATRSAKTLKVVVTVVTCFFILWLPYQVTGTLMALHPSRSATFKAASKLDSLCVSLAYVNCCINPVIYVVAGKTRIRKSLPSILRHVLTDETLSRDSKSVTRSTVDTMAERCQAV